MKRNYVDSAEVWFDQYYQPMTLLRYLRCWWDGVDPRKSSLLNFASYLQELEDKRPSYLDIPPLIIKKAFKVK